MSGAVGGAVHSIILRDAWGKQVHKAGTPTTAYLYTGQRWDELLGLYDYNARWYDPGTGRFVSADTIVPDATSPQSYARYSYVLNRPLSFVDPSGHTAEAPDDVFDPETCEIARWDLSLEEFDAMSIESRLHWIRQFARQTGSGDWFKNIEAIILSFVVCGKSDPGTWISVVDAAILEAIQDGFTASRLNNINAGGKGGDRVSNPGAEKWRVFFDAYSAGRDDGVLARLWGQAEGAATNYGVGIANERGLSPSAFEEFFLFIGDIYRTALAESGGLGTHYKREIQCAVELLPIGRGAKKLLADLIVDMVDYYSDPRSTIGGHHVVYYVATLLWQLED